MKSSVLQRPHPDPRFVRAVMALLAGAWLGCGPSFQQIYESDARFEHCYFLDENPDVSVAKKSACWGDWTKRHTFGQTRDKVRYAMARHGALTRLMSLPTDEVLMGAAPGEGTVSSRVAAPSPTSAFAPPPVLMRHEARDVKKEPSKFSDPPSDATTGDVASLPGQHCTAHCRSAWNSCSNDCPKEPCTGCDLVYQRCMRQCFPDEKSQRP